MCVCVCVCVCVFVLYIYIYTYIYSGQMYYAREVKLLVIVIMWVKPVTISNTLAYHALLRLNIVKSFIIEAPSLKMTF
jgi:hypothetical protein